MFDDFCNDLDYSTDEDFDNDFDFCGSYPSYKQQLATYYDRQRNGPPCDLDQTISRYPSKQRLGKSQRDHQKKKRQQNLDFSQRLQLGLALKLKLEDSLEHLLHIITPDLTVTDLAEQCMCDRSAIDIDWLKNIVANVTNNTYELVNETLVFIQQVATIPFSDQAAPPVFATVEDCPVNIVTYTDVPSDGICPSYQLRDQVPISTAEFLDHTDCVLEQRPIKGGYYVKTSTAELTVVSDKPVIGYGADVAHLYSSLDDYQRFQLLLRVQHSRSCAKTGDTKLVERLIFDTYLRRLSTLPLLRTASHGLQRMAKLVYLHKVFNISLFRLPRTVRYKVVALLTRMIDSPQD